MTTSKVFRFLALPVFLMLGSAQAALIGGYNVDGYASPPLGGVSFAGGATFDELVMTNGDGTLSGVTTDQLEDSFVQLPGTPGDSGSFKLTLNFGTGVLVNDAANNDLVLFGVGELDSFTVTINTSSSSYATVFTESTIAGSLNLNAAAINLNDFGIANGAEVLSIDVELARGNSGFALAGSLAPVPVPAAVWLFGSGLLGLVGVARRKK